MMPKLNPVPFWFLHHGETDWNAEGRSQGHTDIPLNSVGLAQARRAAMAMVDRGIATTVASPLTRALKTAEIVARRRSWWWRMARCSARCGSRWGTRRMCARPTRCRCTSPRRRTAAPPGASRRRCWPDAAGPSRRGGKAPSGHTGCHTLKRNSRTSPSFTT